MLNLHLIYTLLTVTICTYFTDEPGIFLGRISNELGRTFEGYVDKDATNLKIVRNVFKHGDQWFNSGELIGLSSHISLFIGVSLSFASFVCSRL